MKPPKKNPVVNAAAEEPKGRIITISMDETTAGVLMEICGNVAGNTKDSYRKHTDAIHDALESVSVDYIDGAFGEFTLDAKDIKA